MGAGKSSNVNVFCHVGLLLQVSSSPGFRQSHRLVVRCARSAISRIEQGALLSFSSLSLSRSLTLQFLSVLRVLMEGT